MRTAFATITYLLTSIFAKFSSFCASRVITLEDIMYFMMEALIQREFALHHPTITPQRMGDISPSRPWPNASAVGTIRGGILFIFFIYKVFETVLTFCKVICRAILTLQKIPKPLILCVPSACRV